MALAAIESEKVKIISIGEDILHHPELGFKEVRTSALVKSSFEKLGFSDIKKCAITGVRGTLCCGSRFTADTYPVCVAVMGELDAVLSPSHQFADPVTGAAHACGHNAQIAAMLGCAAGLDAVKDYLSGKVCFLAAPGEEFIELEYRSQLRREGKLSFLGGKQQMIYEGVFDDIDMAIMVHSEALPPDAPAPVHIVTNPVSSGFIGKNIRFTGREAHAGGAPWDGVNALNAAVLAIEAIHMQRETFHDDDKVRVHPIITKGGSLVNTVPDDVRMESYVRAASTEAMLAANRKVNRAIKGSASAIGAAVDIEDIPGYLPLRQNPVLCELFTDNARSLLPDSLIEHALPFCGSTDAGDLSCILPVLQPTISGYTGAVHSCDFRISDPYLAYVVPAKLMAMTVIDLLCSNARTGLAIKASYPRRTAGDYADIWKELL